MIIDASTYPTFADAIAAANAVKYTSGSTLYLPGRSAPYDATGLTLPHYTQMYGDGGNSKITGRMTIGSVHGNEVRSLAFLDGINLVDSRGALFSRCDFEDAVAVSGASYYNTFNTCRWQNLGAAKAISTAGPVNFNRLHGCRIYHEGTAVEIINSAWGWTFDCTGFEGAGDTNGALGSALSLDGSSHRVVGCWFERGGNRTYGAPTIDLKAGSSKCIVDGNMMGYLVTVQDLGRNNDIRGYFETRRAD